MTHTQLKTAIANWLKRSDLTADIPTLIQLAEARIHRDVRVSAMSTRATLTVPTGSPSVDLPAAYLEMRSVTGEYGRWTCVPPERLEQAAEYGGRIFSIAGQTLRLSFTPTEDVDLIVHYYAKFAALSADSDTNWILTNHPGVYLWAALAEACVLTFEDNRAPLFDSKYLADVAAMKVADDKATFFSLEMP